MSWSASRRWYARKPQDPKPSYRSFFGRILSVQPRHRPESRACQLPVFGMKRFRPFDHYTIS
jgi:hypothetical protein